MPTMDVDKVVIPHHALFRCVQRAKKSMTEATSIIWDVLRSEETEWFTTPPKGVKRKQREEGVYYGASPVHGVLVVFDEHDRSGNGYVPTAYGWDDMAQEARA